MAWTSYRPAHGRRQHLDVARAEREPPAPREPAAQRRGWSQSLAVSLLAAALTAACAAAETAPPASPSAREQATPEPAHTKELFRATSERRFDDVEYWKKIFDSPKRDSWQEPEAIIAWSRIGAGNRVADIGAGTGYLLKYLSRAVGPVGTVYAVEVEPNLVEHLRKRAAKEGLSNVVPILAAYDDPRLPEGLIDRVVLLDTYHHIDARREYFERLRQRTTPGAQLTVIDWRSGKLPEGPPPDHKLDADQVIAELAESGWKLDARKEMEYHYLLLFTAQPR